MIAALRLATVLTAGCFVALDAAHAQTPATVLHQPARALPGDVRVTRAQDAVTIDWPSAAGERAQLVLSLDKRMPLIRTIAIAGKPVLGGVDPAGVVTVGTRDLKQGWTIFFDNPRQRPFESFPLTLSRDDITVRAEGGYTRVIVGGAAAGPFSGSYQFTLYPGSRLVRAAMVMSTHRPATAYTFDAGLTAASADTLPWRAIAFTDLTDALVRKAGEASCKPAVSPKVRARMIAAEGTTGGALGILPPPHQFYYPLDYANNDNSAWYGSDYRNLTGRTGFGVRQTLEGDRRWVPWVNAPPGSVQDMGVFLLPDTGDAASVTRAALAYTRNDSFKRLAGHHSFTSHYHIEHTEAFLNTARFQQSTQVPDGLESPDFVKRFKDMNVEIVHLAELHLPREALDRAGDRLTLLKMMHAETARLSDDKLLLLPGEEPNVHLGGHWISFFPKPVYWTLDRKEGQPFVEEDPRLGKVYHVGSQDDVLKLMQAEHGLMWTAHPRVKGSLGFPDKHKDTPFFKSDRFLGGAWKNMPVDYSLARLGTRVLDTLDDMNNWAATPAERKFAPGEVDVFQIDRESELYAHMNINYLRLDGPLPRYADGWATVLDALRGGRFFTTTGEVLIPDFTIDGAKSGEETGFGRNATVRATIEWTFPLAYAEIVSGDGAKVYRDRIDLSGAAPFGSRTIEKRVDLRGRKWARIEVWDVATNGAYTPPVFPKAN
ncbi:hypothetical protein FHS95_000491 [Sphingomonas naasensis]|uniref:Discoidin domain-containing protein n=1 Tax=Sphingomonas naasensis TaxID=1344951 RepID=A0A4S1WRN0_9SPHN|nr:hypothetical protein [Sphingomonas naasensis]NIJ18822.1 hypothetical protein [Sphingomonas naasensis]TGX46049.1 hypothetical protein E5A74_02435 [Sphingomonas naasensis]